MTMRRPRKHSFRVRRFVADGVWGTLGPWITISIRLNRPRQHALQRVLFALDVKAPEGWRYIVD